MVTRKGYVIDLHACTTSQFQVALIHSDQLLKPYSHETLSSMMCTFPRLHSQGVALSYGNLFEAELRDICAMPEHIALCLTVVGFHCVKTFV